ncbi:TPA: endonuclease/exonuclease/phosphatase family protein [Streptococcus suis]
MKQISIILANMQNQYCIPNELFKTEKYPEKEIYCKARDREVVESNNEITKILLTHSPSLEIIIFSELQSQESERLKVLFEDNGYLYIQPLDKLKGRQLVTAIAINKKIAEKLNLPQKSTSTLLTENPLQFRNCTIESDIVSITALYLPPRTNDSKRNDIANRGLLELSKHMVSKFSENPDKVYFFGGDLNADFEKIKGLETVKRNINKIPTSYNAWNYLKTESTDTLNYSNKKHKTKIDHLFTNAKIVDFDNQERNFDTDHTFPIITVELDI